MEAVTRFDLFREKGVGEIPPTAVGGILLLRQAIAQRYAGVGRV